MSATHGPVPLRPFRTSLMLAGLAVLFLLPIGDNPLAAQDASEAERDAMFWSYWGVAGRVEGGVVEPHWLSDGSRFWYARGGEDSTRIVLVEPGAGEVGALFDTGRLREAVEGALGHRPPLDGVPFQDLEFTVEPNDQSAGRVRFVVEDTEFEMGLDDYFVRPTGRDEAARTAGEPRMIREAFPSTGPDLYEAPSPDGRWFLRDDEMDLWIRAAADDREERLTEDGEEWFTWTAGGAVWSPSSVRVAALKVDTRHVLKIPLVHWLKPHEDVEWWPFTKAGGALPRYELHIVDALSKRDVAVDVGDDPEVYLSIQGWTPDGSELLFYRMNRAFNRLHLMAADPTTGAARIILTETQPTFIKGINQNPGWSSLGYPLEDGERLLWISERDGWDHIYLYDMSGTMIRRLTRGAWPVVGIAGVDEENGWVYFRAHAESALDPMLGAPRVYDTHLYRVALTGGEVQKLSEAEGDHSFQLSPSLEYFVDVHSTVARPLASELRTTDGQLVQTLESADVSGLADLSWSPPEPFVVKAADGETDLYGVLFKPWDFDAARRYPVLEYIYGGPQTVLHPQSFVAGTMPQAFAQLGYIVVVVDARGTPERGKAFQDVVYGNFGRNEIPDHAAALRGLAATRPWMDLDRVGLFGGSWGGYMTTRALVLEPDLYDAGAATYPVVDLYDHAAQALEPYMNVPEVRPEAFEYGSSLNRADAIDGRLLLIHGTQDVNATFSATMKMVDALTKAGKPYDLVVFPEVNHGVGDVQTYWIRTLRDFFVRNVPPGPAEPSASQ